MPMQIVFQDANHGSNHHTPASYNLRIHLPRDMLDDLDSGYPRGVGAEDTSWVCELPVHGDVHETIESTVNNNG